MDANLNAKTPDANPEHKNSVFTMLFDDEATLIELSNALFGTTYGPDTPIKITTLKNVLFKGRVNDLSFVLDNRLIVLVEHQSTINDTMPYRMLQYITETYDRLYGHTDIQFRVHAKRELVRPKFIVLYNGAEDMKEDVRVLRLSDMYTLFAPEDGAADNGLIDLELTVTVYNIKDGRNAHIVIFCKKLREYAIFTDTIRGYNKTLPLNEALIKAVDECIEKDILREFLEKHKKEVISMLLKDWDLDTALDVRLEEGIEIGKEKGEAIASEKIARAMKEEGADVNFIAKVTNLPIDTILNL